jgi:hypothetical protein
VVTMFIAWRVQAVHSPVHLVWLFVHRFYIHFGGEGGVKQGRNATKTVLVHYRPSTSVRKGILFALYHALLFGEFHAPLNDNDNSWLPVASFSGGSGGAS